jgi:hypothetical protein
MQTSVRKILNPRASTDTRRRTLVGDPARLMASDTGTCSTCCIPAEPGSS